MEHVLDIKVLCIFDANQLQKAIAHLICVAPTWIILPELSPWNIALSGSVATWIISNSPPVAYVKLN